MYFQLVTRNFLQLKPLRQVACDKLVTNDKEYCMKEKVNKYISSFHSVVYVLSHATKMQLFWSQLKANDVLPNVLFILLLLFSNHLGHSI
jgi:hypothetical protein